MSPYSCVPVGLFTILDPVTGPGRTPMTGDNSGLSQTRAIASRYRPPGSGQQGILDEGLRGGGPGRPPFWRTPI